MVELRKRKAPAEDVSPAVKKANPVAETPSNEKGESASTGAAASKKVVTGDTIDLEGFGAEVETQEGVKVTLKKLVEESSNGVVLFTYPKASTPGCTTQACLFRDDFTSLTATGFSIYGLSTDSPKSNTNFKIRQNLPYTLLCDPSATLIAAIGLKKAPSGTTRGVFVVTKDGKVKAVAAGGPAATVDMVRKLVEPEKTDVSEGVGNLAEGKEVEKEVEKGSTDAQGIEKREAAVVNEAKAEVAAEVADSAQKLDADTAA